MAAPKRPTHTVNHPRMYLASGPDGNRKLKRLEMGAPVTLNEEQAKKASKMFVAINSKDAVDLSEPPKATPKDPKSPPAE